MELFRLYGSVMIDNKDSIKKLKESDKRAREAARTFKNMGKTIKKMGKIAAIGVAGASTALIGMANKASETADAIHKGSQRMGISTKAYQELEYWASQNGLAQEQLEKGVGRLNQRMGAAAEGNKKYSEALTKLGVNMNDVKNGTISTEDAFNKAMMTLSGMENQQEKAALATEMFGTKLARDMLPALNDGSLSLEDAKDKAKELGIVIGEDAISDGVKFQDTMDSMKRTLGGLVSKIGLAVLPKLQQFLDWFMKNMPMIKEKVSDGIGKAKDVIDKFKDALQFTKENANILIPVLSGLVAALVAFKVITTINEGIKKARALMAVWKASTFAQTLAQSGLNAALMANPIGLVIAAIAALVAAGVALYMNWDKVKAKAIELSKKAKQIVNSLVRNIKNKFSEMKNAVSSKMQEVWNSIKGIWGTIKSFFSSISLYSIGKDIIQGLINGIKNKISAVKNAVKDVASAITGKIKGILGINSPSKVLQQIGEWTGEGLAIGIDSTIPDISKVTDTMARAANPISSISESTSNSPGLTEQNLQQKIIVQIGNERFYDYIVKAADNGLAKKNRQSSRRLGTI